MHGMMPVFVLLIACQAAFVEAARSSKAFGVTTSRKGSNELVNVTLEREVEGKSSTMKSRNSTNGADELPPNETLGRSGGRGQLGGSTIASLRDFRKVRMLNINTWHEGSVVAGGFEMLVNAIAAVNPDLVVMSEVHNHDGTFHKRLQSALVAKGKIFHGAHGDGDVALLSYWPIGKVEHVAVTIVAYHLQAPQPFVVCAAHLDYHHYASIMPRGYHPDLYVDGQYKELKEPVTDINVLLREDEASGRGPAIQAFLSWVKSVGDAPVILAGDFNECSHLDWTEATQRMRDHHGVAIAWRHSLMLSNAGFHDSWRELYPNAVTHPGATWPSQATGWGNTGWAPKADEHDRIDFAYHNSGLTTTGAWLVGSPRYYLRGKLVSAQSFDPFLLATQELPWPSDHKGLYVEFTFSSTSQTRRFRGHPEHT